MPPVTDARERLNRLIELATAPGPEQQRALAFELCDLLTNWPARYPRAMREPFEALMEKVLRRLDSTTRRLIATRLVGDGATPLALLNAFYFDLPPGERAAVLARNEGSEQPDATPPDTALEASLIEAARQGEGPALLGALADALKIPRAVAAHLLEDPTGDALAVACKGAGLGRAGSSALALMTVPSLRNEPSKCASRLNAFDNVSAPGARALLAYWRQVESDAADPERGAA